MTMLWTPDTDSVPYPTMAGAPVDSVNDRFNEATFTAGSTIPAGTPARLFASERYDNDPGDMEYRFPVDAGTYTVRLFFAEGFFSAVGDRVFDVLIQGQVKLAAFDILAHEPKYVGLMREFAVTTSGEDIVVALRAQVRSPTLSGIEILGVPANLNPPGAPTGSYHIAGDGEVETGVNPTPRAAGYRVFRSATSGSGFSQIADLTSPAYVDPGRTNGATYYYKWRAYNSAGESGDSAEVAATPQAQAGGTGTVLRIQPSLAPLGPVNIDERTGNTSELTSIMSGTADLQIINFRVGGSDFRHIDVVADPLGERGNVWRARILADTKGQAAWGEIGIDRFQGFEKLRLRYWIMYASNFRMDIGRGKLPCLMMVSPRGYVIGDRLTAPQHCVENIEADRGAGTRFMWHQGSETDGISSDSIDRCGAHAYIYDMDKVNRCGDTFDLLPYPAFLRATWHEVTHIVTMNTVGNYNGRYQLLIDGVQKRDLTGRRFRWATTDYGVNLFKFETYFGGGPDPYHPTHEYIHYDDFRVDVVA